MASVRGRSSEEACVNVGYGLRIRVIKQTYNIEYDCSIGSSILEYRQGARDGFQTYGFKFLGLLLGADERDDLELISFGVFQEDI